MLSWKCQNLSAQSALVQLRKKNSGVFQAGSSQCHPPDAMGNIPTNTIFFPKHFGACDDSQRGAVSASGLSILEVDCVVPDGIHVMFICEVQGHGGPSRHFISMVPVSTQGSKGLQFIGFINAEGNCGCCGYGGQGGGA